MEKGGLTLRVDLSSGRSVGPGKIHLLEQIHKSGSIKQAGRALGFSPRRAWLLVNDLNDSFRFPVVEAARGGFGGGSTRLTPFGRKLVGLYNLIKAKALAASWEHRRELEAAVNTDKPGLRSSIKRPLRNASAADRCQSCQNTIAATNSEELLPSEHRSR
jgi:molybdate transport system regulatory protein